MNKIGRSLFFQRKIWMGLEKRDSWWIEEQWLFNTVINIMDIGIKVHIQARPRTSLAIQGLRLCTSTAKGTGSIPGGELRSCMPRGVTKKKKCYFVSTYNHYWLHHSKFKSDVWHKYFILIKLTNLCALYMMRS